MNSRKNMEKLKQQRVEKNITQAFVAEGLGISTRQYMKYENGEVIPKQLVLDKIEEIIAHETIKLTKAATTQKQLRIPVYNVEFTCGFSDMVKESAHVIGYVDWMDEFKGCEIVVVAKNDSMAGVINPGDWVGLKRIYDFTEINFGGIYGVVTKNHNLFKYIRKGKNQDHITIVSENKQYDTREIALDKLEELWVVMRTVPFSQIKFYM